MTFIATDHPVPQMTDAQFEKAQAYLQRLNDAYMHPHTRMRKLYEFADKIWARHYGDMVVCKRGCSHCCHVNVNLTTYEAEYIAVNAKLEAPDLSPSKKGDYTNQPCPFLKDNECSIYEFRPMACRAFGTIDSADYCADKSYPAHQVVALQSPGGGGCDAINWAYHIIMGINDRHPLKDIREFFPDE